MEFAEKHEEGCSGTRAVPACNSCSMAQSVIIVKLMDTSLIVMIAKMSCKVDFPRCINPSMDSVLCALACSAYVGCGAADAFFRAVACLMIANQRRSKPQLQESSCDRVSSQRGGITKTEST